MYKTLLKPTLLTTLIIILSACSDTNIPQVGKQYTLLPSDISNLSLAPVTEVFSLTCTHCRNMESLIPKIEELTNQKIDKIHVTFNQSSQIGAMIYYAAKIQIGKQPDHEFMDELFAVIQQKKGTITEKQASIEAIFHSRNLTSPYQLNTLQMKQLDQYMKTATTVTKEANISSVPSFLVNNKYILIADGHKDVTELSNTIHYLLSKPE